MKCFFNFFLKAALLIDWNRCDGRLFSSFTALYITVFCIEFVFEIGGITNIFNWGLSFTENFDPNTMLFVFDKFRTRLFLLTHVITNQFIVTVNWLIDSADIYKVVSSAYITAVVWFKTSGRSLVKMENKTGAVVYHTAAVPPMKNCHYIKHTISCWTSKTNL